MRRRSSTAWAAIALVDRMVTVFKEILDKHKVPEKESNELLTILGSTKADIVMSGGGE